MAAKRIFQIALVLVVVAASFTIPQKASAGSGCGNTYIVQPGDWLIKIANFCGVTLQALYDANPGVQWQRYIYPGQVLNIPGGGAYIPPVYTPPAYTPPVAYTPPYYPQGCAWGICYNHPNVRVTLHVGDNYISSTAALGQEVTLSAKIHNDGDTPLQLVAYLTPPTDYWLEGTFDDCPDKLGIGNVCTMSWVLTPQVSGSAWVRVYVRGFFTNLAGYQRVTASPAFLFIVP
jgi:LysM repeat protein